MNSYGRQIIFIGAFPLFDYFFTYFVLFFRTQVIIIFIYVVKLMHQQQWSMFWQGQCFGVVNVQVWVMIEVPQGMSHAGALDVSPWSMPC